MNFARCAPIDNPNPHPKGQPMLGFNEFNDRKAQIARLAEAHHFGESSIDYVAISRPRPVPPKPPVSALQVLAVVAGMLIGVVGGVVLERAWTAQIAADAEATQ